jgi:Pyruvate/2-oxoacid:ferredoxin oxidoreductase delta subunit
MCEFCHEHGEGKKWYLEARNYSQDLLHSELSPERQADVGVRNRAEYLARFKEYFVMPAVTGIPKSVEDLVGALLGPGGLHKIQQGGPDLLEHSKALHFGQVLPIEDVERIIDMVDSVTRIPCGCRFLSTGLTDKRYCFGLITGGQPHSGKFPDASSSLEVLGKDEAKRIMREFDREGLIHTVWTGVTPYVIGLCNCDRDCLAYTGSIVRRGSPTFFRAEYVCKVDPDLCSGCKDCVKQCQFGAQFYSSALGKVYIDPTRCFGCGVCRAACPTDAIQMIDRQAEPAAANLWH